MKVIKKMKKIHQHHPQKSKKKRPASAGSFATFFDRAIVGCRIQKIDLRPFERIAAYSARVSV
jgi:hypothetical protein